MVERRLYSSVPPPARTALEDHATLLVSYWCSIFALVIILFRLAGRYVRTERLFREDKIMAASIIPLMGRLGLVHVILLFGTNNADTTGFSSEEIRRRKIGSRLVLLSRILYAAFLWIQKFTITEFLARLTKQYWKRSYEIGLQVINYTLAISFIVVVISTISECHPINHYWQVVPDPGPHCRQAFAQLITMGTCNVITDILLIVFPIPIVLKSQMALKRKIQLTLLFSLSAVPIGITLYRVPSIIDHKGIQQYRTLWASIEILAATAVANALVLGSFVRDRGIKKVKYKFGSAGGDSIEQASTLRRGTVAAAAFWGSDEDLVRGMGMGVDPEFRTMEQAVRPAPMAHPASSRVAPALQTPNWNARGSPSSQDTDNDSEIDLKAPEPARSPGEVREIASRKVSFFDVGGLLDDRKTKNSRTGSESTATFTSRSEQGVSPTTTNPATAAYDFGTPRGRAAGGSGAFLHDVGGLLSSPPQQERRRSSQPENGGTRGAARTGSNTRTPSQSRTSSQTKTSSQTRRPSEARRPSETPPISRNYSRHLDLDDRPLPTLPTGERENERDRLPIQGRRESSMTRDGSGRKQSRATRETSGWRESSAQRSSSLTRDPSGRRESSSRKTSANPGARTHISHQVKNSSPPRQISSRTKPGSSYTPAPAPSMRLQRTATDISLQDVGGLLR